MANREPIISYQLEQLSTSGIPFDMYDKQPVSSVHAELMKVHRHGYYSLAICTQGESRHMLDFEPLLVQPGTLLLIVPGQVHLPLTPHFGQGYMLSFTADFLAAHTDSLPGHSPGAVQLPHSDFEQVVMIARQMMQEYDTRAPHYVSLLQHYLTVVLVLLQRHLPYPSDASQPGPSLLLRYRELLDARFLQWTKPVQYAAALHISPDHLNDIVKQHTGQTASALITARRILEAKRLLLHAQKSVKEIAWHLQFNEVSYFNRFFKQHTGYAPVAFREATRKKYSSIPE